MISRRLTPAEADAIAVRRAAGETWGSIARDLGRNETALIRRFRDIDAGRQRTDATAEQRRGASITNGQPHQPREYSPPIAVADRPVQHGCRVRAPAGVVERVFIWPDTHVPYEDPKAFHVALASARAFQPHRIVLLGDFADFYSVSAHPKHPMRSGGLEAEVAAVNARLDEIQSLGARVTYISGNHEWRLERHLIAKAPELFGFVEASRLFRVAERGWEWVPYMQHVTIGRLHLTHDVGHYGMNAHRLTRQAFESNSVIGHTHRLAVEYVGSAKGSAHVGAMLGWLGDKSQIDYMHAAKAAVWQHGFGLAYHETDTGNVHLVPVPIVDYRCIVEGRLIDPFRGTSADTRGAA